MMTVQEAFESALHHHQAGRLADAEAQYRQILAAWPNHAASMHGLGIIAQQTGQFDLAVNLIGQAMALDPHRVTALIDLGEAYRASGRLKEAVTAYRQAFALQPAPAEAHFNLGNALTDLGELVEAAAAFRRAIEIKPGYPEAHNNLGNVLAAQGRFDEAIGAYRRAIELRPQHASAYNNLGNVLQTQGHLHEAMAAFHRALEIKPDYPQAHYNLGNVLLNLGRLAEAVGALRRAVEIRTDYVEAYNNLGVALARQGQFDEAIAAYHRAFQLKPDSPETCNNLGNALTDQGRFDEAIGAYRQALRIQPDHVAAQNNLGNVLRIRGQLDEAIGAHQRALDLKPDFPDAHNNLGNAFKDRGQLDEAIAAYRQVLRLNPDDVGAHSNLIYSLHFQPRQGNEAILEEQGRWNRRFSEPAQPFIRPHGNDRSPERRLRIGYVSPYFRNHVVGGNLVHLFQYHDHEAFEIVCYSGVLRPDELTAGFRRRADLWRSTIGVRDEALAGMIREDGVDILVDLAQHLAGNRLPVFARCPAPVQASFAGYPESTGVAGIGCRISDRYLESQMVESERAERVFLIDSFWCYDMGGIEQEIGSLPAMENGWITFGSLNNFCKINEPLLRLWAGMLQGVKESRLVLLCGLGSHRQRTVELLEREGINRQRVEFVEPRSRSNYLDLYQRLDIALDPFPYNGHTTSLDALWMGVPVVSLAGQSAVSRAGLSQLSNLGLPELVTHSEDEYLGIATKLAHDLPRLAELRRTLRARMEASVLMDAPRFVRNIEAAYREMWRLWCVRITGHI